MRGTNLLHPVETIARELEFLRQQFEESPIPRNLPAYRRFVLDADDNLWVEHYRVLGLGPRLWSVFSPDGAWLGEVEVPDRFDVTDVGADYVLGVWRDELDEQSVRKYTLTRD